MNIPGNLRYTKEHEWTGIEGDVATIGISQFAVEQLGDITLVEIPEPGDEVTAGETIGTIESVKAVSDMYSPLTGTIDSINDSLEDEPEKVNDDCYGEGWMIKIKMKDPSELEKLFDATAYKTYVDSLED